MDIMCLSLMRGQKDPNAVFSKRKVEQLSKFQSDVLKFLVFVNVNVQQLQLTEHQILIFESLQALNVFFLLNFSLF